MKEIILTCAIVLICLATMAFSIASADASTINFDTFPDGTAVPSSTVITTQYLPLGATFSSTSGGPIAGVFLNEASSFPNFLAGNPNSFQPIIMDLVVPPIESLDVTLISVGDAIVTATALASDLVTILDTVLVTNPGTGVGLGNNDRITLSAVGISRVRFEITEPFSGDGFGIDDVTFTPVPAPSTMLLLATGLLGIFGYRRRRRTSRSNIKLM